MATPRVYADRVKETTTTTGTGTLNLGGAATGGFQTFVSGVGSGNICDYCLLSGNGTDWETGSGTVTSGSPATLSRDTVYASSNSGSKISLTGTSTVFVTNPARRVQQDIFGEQGAGVPAIGGFTKINCTGTGAAAQSTSGIITISDTGANTLKLIGITKAVPAAPYRVSMLIQFTSQAGNYSGYAWGFSDGTKFDVVRNTPSVPSSNEEQWSTSTSRAAFNGKNTVYAQGCMVGGLWVSCRDDNTNIYCDASADGANWTTVYTVAKSSGYLGSSGYTNLFVGLVPESTTWNNYLNLRCYDTNGLNRALP